ncbi:MAG: Ig domain-containing protein [Bacteroidales bacterium]|nr:Ig domain-containing protein [Bacteroidales bacterium]
MKKSLTYTFGIIWLLVSIMFSSCKKEVVEPKYNIEGYYVLDDGSNLTDEYILFKDATLSVFKAREKMVFIDDAIWNYKSQFYIFVESRYSIHKGLLQSELGADMPIRFENGVLRLGTKRYSAWSGQTERACYSTIIVRPTKEASYSAQWDSIPYFISKPIGSGHLTAVSNESWLTVENVSDDRIIVRLDENNSSHSRDCALLLSYDGGATTICEVTQNYHPLTVELNRTSLVLYRGTSNVTEALIAIVTPSDAINSTVSWISSNPSVATVSNSGVVTGKAKGKATVTVTANAGNGAQASCDVEVKQYVTSIVLDKTTLSLMIGDEASLSVTDILPHDANDKAYFWSSSDSEIVSIDNSGNVVAKAKGKATINAIANDGSEVFASCIVRVRYYSAVAGDAVDLKLSVKWGSMNLGATSSYDRGDYFAWGETSPKDFYWWTTYELCHGSSSTLTRYNNDSTYGTVDNKTEFKDYDYEDDAARQALGGKWRMPTDAEWTELRTKCTWTWIYQNVGYGYKVTGTNGNSIFLPAAGSLPYDGPFKVGSSGYYWSSSLHTNSRHAWNVFFENGYKNSSLESRCTGHSIRPVSEY